ncbi:MAG: formylglycine-generating enzyme family protein [Dehalococcoidia bacterium]|nr:formylglycine-generating enzyme family protein [Dehalococcoidia bacterium]
MVETSTDARIARLLREGPAATPFVELPGGVFAMGAAEGAPGRPDERPARLVRVRPFAVALVPVTNLEYARFLDANGHAPPGSWDDPRFTAPDCPVVGVSWFDAVDYCAWVSQMTGRACRLPTEAEREYAARGGVEGVAYPWGDAPWTEGVHGLGALGADRPHPVGTSAPNGYGLYHMADNVHEWCSDWYDAAGYALEVAPAAGVVEDPRGPTEERDRRASRGGSWRHRVKVARIAARSSLAPDRRYNDYGMRVYADVRSDATVDARRA